MKKLAIILPGRDFKPVGGYKIAYEYADFFAGIGYEVYLLYNYEKINFFSSSKNGFFKLKAFIGFYYRQFRKQLELSNWYFFKYNVKKDILFNYKPFFLNKYKDFDAVFATAVETAYALNNVKSIPDKQKFYLIQDFENWNSNTDEYCYNSYKFPFTKIVISKWLQKKVEETGNTATLIPNGLDFDYFKLTVPIETRKSTEIAMLYHLDDRKRCCDSMAALEIVKKQIPDLHVTMFGTPEKPVDLPDWYSYYRTPDRETHNAIYNNAAIFVAASMKEGWALPPAEALQCGSALVCTDIGGFSAYAINNETALVSKVYDVQALAENILKLIKDNDLRIRIAKNGNKYIQQFTWEKSFNKMQELIEHNITIK